MTMQTVPRRAPELIDESALWIGTEVKNLRKARGFSLQQLSERCGKSVSYLSQLERGVSRPTIGALQEVSRALDVQMSWFFPQGLPMDPSDDGIVVRVESRRCLSFASGVADYLLSPNLSGQLELLLCVLQPGAESGQTYSHRGEEAGMVIKGVFELWVDDKSYLLNTGDSFSFSSNRQHRYRNPGADEARVVWVITPPTY